MELPSSLFGWIAMLSSIPLALGDGHQLYKIIKSRSAKEMSVSWCAYGVEKRDFFLIITNAVYALLAVPLLFCAFKFRKGK